MVVEGALQYLNFVAENVMEGHCYTEVLTFHNIYYIYGG